MRINLSISRTETRNFQTVLLKLCVSIYDRNKKLSVFFTFVFSIKFIKSVASLKSGFCDYDISCSNVPLSTKEEVLSVRPSDES